MDSGDKAVLTFFFVVVLLVAGCVTAFRTGKNQGLAVSRSSKAQVSQLQTENTRLEEALKTSISSSFEAADKYNSLVTDYNNLRSAVVKYVGATQYQARAPITCNTYNYSALDSSTTRCY